MESFPMEPALNYAAYVPADWTAKGKQWTPAFHSAPGAMTRRVGAALEDCAAALEFIGRAKVRLSNVLTRGGTRAAVARLMRRAERDVGEALRYAPALGAQLGSALFLQCGPFSLADVRRISAAVMKADRAGRELLLHISRDLAYARRLAI